MIENMQEENIYAELERLREENAKLVLEIRAIRDKSEIQLRITDACAKRRGWTECVEAMIEAAHEIAARPFKSE